MTTVHGYHRWMRIGCLVVACVACGPRAPRGEPARETIADDADAAARVAAASKAWLAGDLDRAIAELGRAGGDPTVQALLARAYLAAGRDADARRTIARAVGGKRVEARLVADVSRIDRVAVSPDGAYIATVEDSWQSREAPATITVWSTLMGRDTVTTTGDLVAFGRAKTGEMVAVVIDSRRFGRDPGELRAIDAATGAERWSHVIDHASDIAIDRHATITTLGNSLARWDLSTGAKLRRGPAVVSVVVQVSADGRTALAADTLVDLATSNELATLPAATLGSGILGYSVSPDGQTVAAGNKDDSVVLYNRDGKVRRRIAHAGWQAQFVDDGTLIATDGKHVTRWDASGRRLAGFDLPAELSKVTERTDVFGVARIAIGAGGHAVLRRGGELVVVQLAGERARIVASLGLATRADVLAWSADGAELAIGGARGDIAVWSATGAVASASTAPPIRSLGFDAQGKVVVDGASSTVPTSSIAIADRRAFERPDPDGALRLVEAPEPLVAATVEAGSVAAAGASGTLYLWDADTAEGLGAIDTRSAVTAMALRPDGRLLAVARSHGGVEVWDLPSRTLAFTLATWTGGWAAVAPSGRVDGMPRGIAATIAGVAFPGDGLAFEPGLAATALAHPPAPIEVARTPAVRIPPRACLPAGDSRFRPVWTDLEGDEFSYCLREGVKDDPLCFQAHLAVRSVSAIPAPLEVVLDQDLHTHGNHGEAGARIEEDGSGLKVCKPDGSCQTLPVTRGEADQHRTPLAAVSDDGALAAIGSVEHAFVETYDVATGKRIARFRVRYGTKSGEITPELGFFSHDVLAISKPCAGPCADAVVYTARGQSLGPFAVEASGPDFVKFHDDVWVIADDLGSFAIQDAATGRILARRGGELGFAVTPDRVAVVFGDPKAGAVVVFDRHGHVTAEVHGPPRCREP